MPRPDAAKILAKDLHNLPHPDGRRIVLCNLHPIGKTPEVKARMARESQDVGDALIHKLERHGYTVSHKDDPKPADSAADYKKATLYTLGGKLIGTIGLDANLDAHLGNLAIKNLIALLTEAQNA